MSFALAKTSNSSFNSGIPLLPKKIISKNKISIFEFLKNDKIKEKINYIANGSSSVSNLLTFLNGNFHFLDSAQEKLETASEFLTKFAYAKISALGAMDLWGKKNLFPFLGYALSVPIGLFSSGYNLWVSNGITSGLINFLIIMDQREIVDSKGEPILDKNKNLKVVNGDFGNRGWTNSFTTTLNESTKIIKELLDKPSRIKKISHAAFVASIFQISTPIFGFLGLERIESFVRNASTAAVEGSMMLHKNIKNNSDSSSSLDNKRIINLKSPVAQSGLLWVGTSIVDFLKRFDYFSEKINNLTQLSFFFDRAASIRFTHGLFEIKKDHYKPSNANSN